VYRIPFLALLSLLIVTALSASPPASLVWVERAGPYDVDVLLAAGLPVVTETAEGLLVNDGRPHLSWLERNGYEYLEVDRGAEGREYALVGLRPDSDVEEVLSHGQLLLERANWLLLGSARGTSFEELRAGRVFVTVLPREPMAPRRPAPAAAAERQSRVPQPLVQKIVDSIDNADIDQYWQDITSNPPTGTRYTTALGCEDAAAYCYDFYDALGIDVQYHDWSTTHAPNVVASIEGAVNPDDVYIMIGHLDDLPQFGPAPGADDNASGSIYQLAAAEAMSCYSFKNTVKFLNVTGEEVGLLGSSAYASDAQQSGENILGVINMDMIGWEGDGSPATENLDLNYNSNSQWLGELFAENAADYNTGLVVDAFYCPSLSASDHYPFWQRGWSAVCGITDNEGYCGHGGNYPHYHTSQDTIANCGDPSFFYSVVKASTATFAELAEPFKITMGAEVAACGAPIDIFVGDADLNTDPQSVQTVEVAVWSDTETTPELLTLAEHGLDSRAFSGQISTTFDPPSPGDGLLTVSPGDTISAEYIDALDCDGEVNVVYRATSGLDCGPPVISNVGESDVSDVAASIVWNTNEQATSKVYWGDTVPPTNIESSADLTLDHSVPIGGLQECTVYYYSVESVDGPGNPTSDDNGGQYYHFETLGDFGDGLQPCRAGSLAIDLPVYRCDASIALVLTDLDLNLDPQALDTALVPVTSSTETTPEMVLLQETAPNSSRYTGTITLDLGPEQRDGFLQVKDGDIVTATYIDEDDGSGSGALTFDTASLDCGGPVITNLRIRDVTDQRMTVLFETDRPADGVLQWGPTAALGQSVSHTGLTTTHSIDLNRLNTCEPLYFRVESTDELGNTTAFDIDGAPFLAHSWDIPGLYWRETFESGAPGWSLQGEWEVGEPQGLGGSSGYPDPGSAYNHSYVLGNDLTGAGALHGDYEHATVEEAETPELNARDWSNVKLLLYRQLNVRHHDDASIVIVDRNRETEVYTSNGQNLSQSGYTAMPLDISSAADGARNLVVRFGLTSDGQNFIADDGVASGWNIDDVILKDGSLPDYAPCGGCGAAPSFKGIASAYDLDACGGGGISLEWDEAVSWGTGAAGTYAVYRDSVDGFTPSAANRIAFGLTDLSWVDSAAPQDQTHYYLVVAENDESCGGGPSNGGLTDSNGRYVAVFESTATPDPAEVEAVTLRLTNYAHLTIDWQPSAVAASYRIWRSESPQPGGFTQIEETAEPAFEDLFQGSDPASYYYLVTAINGCGVEGP
jgi:Zn-dependent M28 family amino/carboxypeptidase